MEKSDQWKLAAIIISNVDRLQPGESQRYRDLRAAHALETIVSSALAGYDWREVVRSHRERTENAKAKKARAS